MSKNNKIGEKLTFTQLCNYNKDGKILIPAIQRDYTYGALTTQTEKVLDNLLSALHDALMLNSPCTLNFIYGYREQQSCFVPLDGQQRLTTLFLLHYYAALHAPDADFDLLRRFSYATRASTRSYCEAIIEHHEDIRAEMQMMPLKDAIAEMPWFLPSFADDPSIRSMQVVLDRIAAKFATDKELLWQKLTASDCPVTFYLLDFGPFGLSDDLYVKMNARGKGLTHYEIFKSLLLKHVELTLGDVDLRREMAMLFDNDWTDLIWETIGRPTQEEEMEQIDRAYIALLEVILTLLNFINGSNVDSINLSKQSIEAIIRTKEDVKFISSMLTTFRNIQLQSGSVDNAVNKIMQGLRQVKKEKYIFTKILTGKNCTNADLLLLYGQYLAFATLLADPASLPELQIRMRHLRNLIENSDDEIRKSKIPALLSEVKEVMEGKLTAKENPAFNTVIWEEECLKEAERTAWSTLFDFEEHPLLSGALSSFGTRQTLHLDDPQETARLTERLNKFAWLFDDNASDNDMSIRAALLTHCDYTQYYGNNDHYRIIGCQRGSWRPMLVKNLYRHNQEAVMEAIDSFNPGTYSVESELEKRIAEGLRLSTLDWRYYAIKYREHIYVSYDNPKYGYIYIDPAAPLEAVLLQSSYYGESNVAWYMLHHILYRRNAEKHDLTLYKHAARPEEANLIINSGGQTCELGITQQGWQLYGLTADEAALKGLAATACSGESLLFTPPQDADFIEWAEQNILAHL